MYISYLILIYMYAYIHIYTHIYTFMYMYMYIHVRVVGANLNTPPHMCVFLFMLYARLYKHARAYEKIPLYNAHFTTKCLFDRPLW